MPANLTPQYKAAEQRYREARSHDDKVAALREMMALLPKHKGTEKLQADLKSRIAKLEDESERSHRGGAHRHDPGHVRHEGAGQWVLVGLPNSGKSALVRALTHAHPEVAAYPFATRVPSSGMMPFEDVQIQLVDTPAFAPQHSEPYLPNLVRNADGVLWVLDVAAGEFEESARLFEELLEHARVHPSSRAMPEDAPPFLEVRPVMVVVNKCDLDGDGTLTEILAEVIDPALARFRVSAERGDGLDLLKQVLFDELKRVRIYTKEPGKKPDLERPFVLRAPATVHDLALVVHKEVAGHLRYARIWGHARFDGQQVDREHVLADRDIVELHTGPG